MRIQESVNGNLKSFAAKVIFAAAAFVAVGAVISAPAMSHAEGPNRDSGIDWAPGDDASIDYQGENPDRGGVYQEDGTGYGDYADEPSVDWGETENLPDESTTWED